MKKIIIGTLITGCMLFASDKAVEFKSDLFDLNKVKSEEMKGFLIGIESSFSSITKVVKDYYEVKTCNKEFYNEVTEKDVKEFITTSSAFAVLVSLKIIDDETSKYTYEELINDYKFMNCGEGKANLQKYKLKEEKND